MTVPFAAETLEFQLVVHAGFLAQPPDDLPYPLKLPFADPNEDPEILLPFEFPVNCGNVVTCETLVP